MQSIYYHLMHCRLVVGYKRAYVVGVPCIAPDWCQSLDILSFHVSVVQDTSPGVWLTQELTKLDENIFGGATG